MLLLKCELSAFESMQVSEHCGENSRHPIRRISLGAFPIPLRPQTCSPLSRSRQKTKREYGSAPTSCFPSGVTTKFIKGHGSNLRPKNSPVSAHTRSEERRVG